MLLPDEWDDHLTMITIIVMKPCFHVVCKTCVDELVLPSKQCVVCDSEVKAGVDVLELKREGPEVVLITIQSISAAHIIDLHLL